MRGWDKELGRGPGTLSISDTSSSCCLGSGAQECCALMSCLCRQAFAGVRLLKVILNLPFIRDQRKELKAAYKTGEGLEQPRAWEGETCLQSPRLEAMHSQPWMWGGMERGHSENPGISASADCWHSNGCVLGFWLWFHLDPIKNQIIKTSRAGALASHHR